MPKTITVDDLINLKTYNFSTLKRHKPIFFYIYENIDNYSISQV